MNRSASEFVDVQWVARCAHRLRRRWAHVDVALLAEAATELWRIDWLREMAAEDAAELWLQPLSSRPSGEIV